MRKNYGLRSIYGYLYYFSIFMMCFMIPVTVYALFMRRVPKLKLRDVNDYGSKINSIRDVAHLDVKPEDIKHMRF